jgi:DNA-binding SARP family transcriptional activator
MLCRFGHGASRNTWSVAVGDGGIMKQDRGKRGIHFAGLGPVQVLCHGEELNVGPRQQKALLAAVLLRHGTTATAAQLIDDIWGENPPEQAKAALRTYASGLRRALGSASGLLVSRSGGYALRRQGADAVVDVDSVSELAAEAEQAEQSGDLEWARELYGMALGHWTGEPLAHIPGPFAQAHRLRLQEWHLALQERRLSLDLQLGRHGAAVAELTVLTAMHPLRERLREMLMLALCASGRQAEALAVYSDTRSLLSQELGIDPSPRLQRRFQQILCGDTGVQLLI